MSVTAGTLAAVRPGPPVRVRLGRIAGVCAALLAAEVATVLAASGTLRLALHLACATVMLVFALVFVLRAVTVAGFSAGIGAAGLTVLEPGWLLPVLGGAVLLALGCGVSPAWARVELWQASRSGTLTARQEAAMARSVRTDPGNRLTRARGVWRSDRVLATFLVLAYPPLVTAGALWLLAWMASRSG